MLSSSQRSRSFEDRDGQQFRNQVVRQAWTAEIGMRAQWCVDPEPLSGYLTSVFVPEDSRRCLTLAVPLRHPSIDRRESQIYMSGQASTADTDQSIRGKYSSMTSNRTTLIDVASGRSLQNAVIDAASTGLDLSGHSWSVHLTRLHGGPSDGVDLIKLSNGHLRLWLLPTRGMGVWKAECGELPLKWDSPVVHPVHPSLVDPSRRGGTGWLDGFNELICRCGLNWHGAPGIDTLRDDTGTIISEQFLPLHGRIANLPAHKVSVEVDDNGLIRLTGIVDETSVFGERLRLESTVSTRAGAAEFSIRDTVSNLGGTPAEVEMLYHSNFGTPLLGNGSTFHTAATRVAPRDDRAAEGIHAWETFLGPTPGFAEQVYFVTPVSDDSNKAIAVLLSPDSQAALALRFHTTTLPCFTLWKNTQAAEDGYCCGLEPSSSLPNNRGFEREQGRVLTLPPGDSIEFQLEFEIAASYEQAQSLIEEVSLLQKRGPRTTEIAPVTGLSPA